MRALDPCSTDEARVPRSPVPGIATLIASDDDRSRGGQVIAVDAFMLVFRFVHIVAGVLWVGSAFLFVAIIGPSAAEVGPSAGPLMTAAVKKRKAVKVITALGVITVVAGWILWLRNMNLSASLGDWVTSSFGLALTIGGVLATITFFVGYVGVGRNVERLVDLGGEVAASGGTPTPEQQGRLDALGAALERHGKTDLVLLLLAVTAMATARYW
jgi:hypothetical protein